MGFASRGITSADILAAITSDSVKFRGGDLSPKPIWEWNAQDENRWAAKVGTWELNANPAVEGGSRIRNAGAIAALDELGLGSFYVPIAGDYTLTFTYAKGNNYGRYGWIIDGTPLAFVEGYNAAATYDNIGTVALTSLTKALHFLALYIPSKHASSSDFNAQIMYAKIVMD